MQHLTSVRYTSCTACIMLQDKASCVLAAMRAQLRLLALPPCAPWVKAAE